MQAAVEGTLDLVKATQISCRFCGGNLEYVDDYRQRRTGGLWKGSNCSWDQAEEWHAMEVRSHLLMKRLWSEDTSSGHWRRAGSSARTMDGSARSRIAGAGGPLGASASQAGTGAVGRTSP